MNIERLHKDLYLMQDTDYKAFHARLIPNIDPDRIIGIRTPVLRKFATTFSEKEATEFMRELPHKYYEENNLHAFLIEHISDFDKTIYEIDRFLPYVDNWATCDSMRPAVLATDKERLLAKIREWLKSEHTYTVRYGIEMLMCHYLDDDFEIEYADAVSNINSDEYYINMMIAWYFATALAKKFDAIIPYIEQRRLPRWTHNKAIQKAIESLRITDKQKDCLKQLKF